MERIILTITSDLFDDPNQEASIRNNVSVRTLLGDIQKEFSLSEGNYAIRVKGSSRPLDLDRTMEQLGIQTGAELVFGRERRSAARAAANAAGQIRATRQAYVKEEETGKIFEIEWQPAIIGRPDASNPAAQALLAVDLGGFEEARSVSRQHASISERNGIYFLESLSEHNPALINDQTVYAGERRSMQDGDRLLIGKIALIFRIREPGRTSQTDLPIGAPGQPTKDGGSR